VRLQNYEEPIFTLSWQCVRLSLCLSVSMTVCLYVCIMSCLLAFPIEQLDYQRKGFYKKNYLTIFQKPVTNMRLISNQRQRTKLKLLL
jgi:hypothetical protein